MLPNTLGSEQLAILASIDPSNQAAGTAATGWISVSLFHALLAVIQTGTMANNATLDAKLQQATDTNGAGVKDVPGKSIATIAQSDNGAGRQALIDVRAEDLDIPNGYGFVRLSLTTAVAASYVAAKVLGVSPRKLPAHEFNQATVLEVR